MEEESKRQKKKRRAAESTEKGMEESGYIKRISVGFGTNNFENWRFVCERIQVDAGSGKFRNLQPPRAARSSFDGL